MPLNKSNINETVSATRYNNLENEFFTPNKARDTDRTLRRDNYSNKNNNNVLGSALDSLVYNSNHLSTVMSQEKTT